MDKDILYRMFEGIASVDELKAIKHWTESSEENEKQLHKERKLFDAMLLTASAKDEGSRTKATDTRHRMPEWLKIAATVAVTVCITSLCFFWSRRPDVEQLAMHTISVPAGQRVHLQMPDGTSVWLNAGSRMHYPLSFMGKAREVTLDGEAYFEVQHDDRIPFIVHTKEMDIQVLGTTFNVEAYTDRNLFRTSLLEGEVKVSSPSEGKESITLAPNQKIALQEGHWIVSEIDDPQVFRWREGLYCFRQKRFADILKDLERYYDLQIRLEKSGIADVELTGKFRIADGWDYALQILQYDVSFTYVRSKEDNIIYIK